MRSSFKSVALLGSTGSIGRNTLEVARGLGSSIRIVGLAADRSADVLAAQVAEFKPVAVSMGDESLASRVKRADQTGSLRVYWGREGLERVATLEEADLVVNALVGSVGILPSLAAIRAGKRVALANKECLVAAGRVMVEEAARSGSVLLPIDSEHSAVYQCLRHEEKRAIRRLILTASGGPLVDHAADRIAEATPEEALSHPTWEMGKKVTIDSATLLNKGFEVIEAHWLFGIPSECIEVVVERKSLVHSLVEFVDGTVMAVLSEPDMKLPIQYALTFPKRAGQAARRLDLTAVGPVSFEKPDLERFPCLALAYGALRMGGTAPAVLSAADEIAVEAFLAGKIGFGDIHGILARVLSGHTPADDSNIQAVLDADRWARAETRTLVDTISLARH